MEYRRFDRELILRLDPGDELCGAVTAVCRIEGISLASVCGIGACDRAEIGLYDVSSRKFTGRTFSEPLEIACVAGNVTEMDGQVYLHLHITLADSRMRSWSGHLKSCRISATAEIILRIFSGRVGRVYDDATGLNILDFSGTSQIGRAHV